MTRTEKEKIVKGQWKNMLRAMINIYRKSVPNDSSSDLELAKSLMDHFCKSGPVQKDQNGKYILPYINFNA